MSQTEEKRVSTKATSIVGLAVLCSRVLGLIREMVVAALFGASRNMDAFLTAFRAPNMLRDLFAEGALSTAFVTTFSRRIATEGDQSAWRLASKVATLTLVFMSAMTLLGILFAPFGDQDSRPWLPGGKSRPNDPADADHVPVHSPRLTRRAGNGNAEREKCFRRSGDGFELLQYRFDRRRGRRCATGSIRRWTGGIPILANAGWSGSRLGLCSAVSCNYSSRFPSASRAGFRFRFDFNWRDPGVSTILALMGPATIAASAVQVNVAVNSGFASTLGNGPITWLNIAFRLMQLPLGVFGVAVATVTFRSFRAVPRWGTRRNFAARSPTRCGWSCFSRFHPRLG